MKKLFLQLIIALVSITAYGQIEIKEPPPNPAANPTPEYYQIFIDQPAQEIQRAIFKSSGKRIKSELSEDKTTIILRDYKGRGTVSVLIKYADGRVEEIIKSSCHIVPYPYFKKEL